MSASCWFLCVKSGHYFCMHTLADKRTQWPTLFSEWFCNSEANRHEICTILRQRVSNKVSRLSSESVKSHSMKLTMMFKLDLKKNDAYRIYNPGAERVNAKSQDILHRKWTLACILCTHQKSYKLDKGIMFILKKIFYEGFTTVILSYAAEKSYDYRTTVSPFC